MAEVENFALPSQVIGPPAFITHASRAVVASGQNPSFRSSKKYSISLFLSCISVSLQVEGGEGIIRERIATTMGARALIVA
ncbi:hypothetical protein EPI10_029068 [Gossypium australe]|uniref:Uncharacterized protein n=1 Tax=Gossypium australe TaxID=47621 RepID=A0A5B6V0D8_9ROSI|nr:hypothetical protein EPI10_029068 [Gossypium australe]